MPVRPFVMVWIACVSLVVGLVVAVPAVAAQSASTGPVVALAGPVKTADLSQFQPGDIISDAVFFNSGTMSAGQIQSFLESKVPQCTSGYTCLKDWYDTSRSTSADAMCGAYSGGYSERASTIIYKVAQACGINPQVILATLEKEQGLVTHVWPSDWRYTIAMGQGCPDTAGCDTRYFGFFNQVYGAAWQLKRYANPPGTSQYFTWYAPGNTWNVRYNPDAGCGSSPVYIQNQATADLYYYTPYQPNAAAIRAGYGEGDGCSAYGNRNFFQNFTDWFGSTTRNACDQPPYGQVRGASGFMKTTAVVPARSSSYVDCNDGALWLDKDYFVTVSAEWGDWYWVNVSGHMLWIQKSSLISVNPCDQPPYNQVRGASGTMQTTAVVPARASASIWCNAGALWLDKGATVTVAAEWGDWYWVDITGQKRWMEKSSLAPYVDPCTQPPYGQVSGASGSYVTTTAVTARVTANTACATGAIDLVAGASVSVSAQWGDWYWVSSGGSMLWLPKSTVAPVAVCAQPPYDQVRGASGLFVTSSGAIARATASTECGKGSLTLAPGTVVRAAAQWGPWYWAEISGSMYWIQISDLTAETACRQPPYEAVRGASGMATLTRSSIARPGPYAACDSTTVPLSVGQSVKVGAVWDDWYWVAVGSVMLWVPVADVAVASSTMTTTTSVNLRSSPSTDAIVLVVVATGTTVNIIGGTNGWYNVQVGSRTGWISSAYLR